jgi:hypothetical protein
MSSKVWERFVSQVKESLLNFQKNDKEEKTIVLHARYQPKKLITLPWPPIFRSHIDLQGSPDFSLTNKDWLVIQKFMNNHKQPPFI